MSHFNFLILAFFINFWKRWIRSFDRGSGWIQFCCILPSGKGRELQREKTHQTVTSNFLQNNYKTCLCWHTQSISRYIPRDDALLTSSSANTILLLRDDIGFLELKKLLMNSLFFYPREPRKTFFKKKTATMCVLCYPRGSKGLRKAKTCQLWLWMQNISISFEHKWRQNSCFADQKWGLFRKLKRIYRHFKSPNFCPKSQNIWL